MVALGDNRSPFAVVLTVLCGKGGPLAVLIFLTVFWINTPFRNQSESTSRGLEGTFSDMKNLTLGQ
jgi:hypothetical protein